MGGALLRRERLLTSHISEWRQAHTGEAFTPGVRRLLNTTNGIESLNYQLRMVTARLIEGQRTIGRHEARIELDIAYPGWIR
jgi:hypothetical protein